MNAQTHAGFLRIHLRRGILFCVVLISSLVIGCSSKDDSNGDARGIVVVNAPAAGVVKRILTAEGVHINQGTPVIEIEVASEMLMAMPSPGDNAEGQAVRNYKAADAEIEAARAEAVRHGAEVERLTPLVASGEVSQGQVDGERALYETAQRRLQQAQDTKRRAESGLLAARQPGLNKGATAQPAIRAQVVAAVATSSGTVAVINVRVGEKVAMGQPLATLKADQ